MRLRGQHVEPGGTPVSRHALRQGPEPQGEDPGRLQRREDSHPGGDRRSFEVWSLTELYPVDFSKSRIGVKSAFSTNAQSRFASVVDGVLRPPRLARHT